MDNTYWSSVLDSRISRRRALAVTGSTAAAAAFLVACGGSDNGGSKDGDKSGLLATPVDTSKQAKRGGINKWYFTSENATLDIHVAGAPLNVPRTMVYSDLFMQRPGYLADRTYADYDPDLAESWEFSPDRLQITFKLRDGVKWHNKAPVNGRALDGEDYLFSWQRFEKQGRIRTSIANSANPNAPVLGWTMPDARTLVMKVKEPTVDLFASFSAFHAGLPSIIPKETDNGFDMRRDMIGTGPWVLDNYTPSVGMKFRRNPDYYFKDRLFMDGIEAPFVSEYAQRLAQFRAGGIYTLTGSAIRQEDVLSLKRDLPELGMFPFQPGSFAPGQIVTFGWQPTEANKPFKDERVRQALSMSYDRELYIETFGNVSEFRNAGLPVETFWNSSMGTNSGAWLLDPRSKDFGPNAKYYEHNIAEAKKLLAAAGYANGVDVSSNYISGAELGSDWQKTIQVTEGFASEVGFRPKANLIDYQKEYGPVIRDGHGKFDGWGYTSSGPSGDDAVTYYSWRFHKTGQVFLGHDALGKGDGSGDPLVDGPIEAARREFDTTKRMAIIHDLQRYLAKAQYCVPIPGFSSSYAMAWPAVGNYGVWEGDKRGENYNWWLDDTKAPLKKA
jgi:ABC-type transport system substrate-binding protein